jgi:hypothetical protein
MKFFKDEIFTPEAFASLKSGADNGIMIAGICEGGQPTHLTEK